MWNSTNLMWQEILRGLGVEPGWGSLTRLRVTSSRSEPLAEGDFLLCSKMRHGTGELFLSSIHRQVNAKVTKSQERHPQPHCPPIGRDVELKIKHRGLGVGGGWYHVTDRAFVSNSAQNDNDLVVPACQLLAGLCESPRCPGQCLVGRYPYHEANWHRRHLCWWNEPSVRELRLLGHSGYQLAGASPRGRCPRETRPVLPW